MASGRPPLRVIEGGGRPRLPLAPAVELTALGLGLTLVFTLMARVPSWFHALGTFQVLYLVAFAFFALALFRLERYAALPRAAWAVLVVAVAARAALLPVPPSLSGDVHRYVWEGRVINAGGNPYAQSPLDPELDELRDREIWPGINHKHLSTIYPPLAEAGFALVARISATVTAFKLWSVGHEVVLILVLLGLVRRAGGRDVQLIAYAWNPLVIVEFAGMGHNDPTAMLWLALAFHQVRSRPVLSALALSAGVLVKLVPLIAAPFLFVRWPWRARVVCLVVLGAGLGWFWALTRGVDSGLSAYWSTWRNNDLVFHYLERLTGHFAQARMLALGLVVGGVAFALWKRWEPLRGARLALRTATVTSPVVHPWYLGWVVLFEPLRPSTPWLMLSCTVFLSYGVFTLHEGGRAFHLPLAWRWLEYGVPALVGFGLWLRRRWRDTTTEEA